MNSPISLSRRSSLKLFLGGIAASQLVGLTPASAAKKTTKHKDIFINDGLVRSIPEEQGIDSKEIIKFLDDANKWGFEIHSFMLARNEKVVAEGWWEPYRPELSHVMHSLTKSVTACAVGIAIDEGYFKLEDKVISFFKENLPKKIDDKLAAMTVEDLLSMRTGHEKMVSGSVWRQINTSWIDEFFKIPVVYQPGTKFVYTSAASYMLSALVTKTTGKTTADFLEEKMFKPMGINNYQWPLSPDGVNPGGNGLSWKTSDSLKLGMLHAQNGMWNNKRILSKKWIEQVQKAHTEEYGYQWWLEPGVAYVADGLFYQLSVVFPKYNATLAMSAAIPEGSGFWSFLFNYFPKAFVSSKKIKASKATIKLPKQLQEAQIFNHTNTITSNVGNTVSGQLYKLKENEEQVKSLRFDFSKDSCVFTLEDHRGKHSIINGFYNAIDSKTSMTGNKLHHQYQPEIMLVSATAKWLDQRTLMLRWTFYETAWTDTVLCQFNGKYVRLHRTVNVNPKTTQQISLRGKISKKPSPLLSG